MNIVLFEDDLVEQLFPITLTRPAYSVTCGALRLIDLVTQLDGRLRGVVRDYLTDFQQDYFANSEFNPSENTLWINARLLPDARFLAPLKGRLQTNEPFATRCGSSIAAALTKPSTLVRLESATHRDIVQYLEDSELPDVDLGLKLVDFPHTLLEEQCGIISGNLEVRLGSGRYREVADGVYSVGPLPARVPVHFDSKEGPILLDAGVCLGAFSVLHGPVFLDRQVQVSPHAFLKGPLSVGHTVKIGGEVSRSIFEPYSNKVHCGYLGSSYVGSWVNLGGGTTNSNLKNTYGSIRVDYGGRKLDTGMQFLGCIIGDFTKTAINTSIYTGKVLGACSNVYGTVTTNVPSFANYARSLGDVTDHPSDVMIVTQKRVFARRGIEQESRHVRLLRDIYNIESPKRELANQPPTL